MRTAISASPQHFLGARLVSCFHSFCYQLSLNAEIVQLKSGSSPVDNHLKELVPYSDDVDECDAHFPHSLEFDYLPLAKLMRGAFSFDWEPMEALLDNIATRGNQAVFRLWIEYPGNPSGLPECLCEQEVNLTSWKNKDEKTICHKPEHNDEQLVAARSLCAGSVSVCCRESTHWILSCPSLLHHEISNLHHARLDRCGRQLCTHMVHHPAKTRDPAQ